MKFYVYKNTAREGQQAHKGAPEQWRLSSEHEKEHKAVFAAEQLCPRGAEIDTLPANGLKRALFRSTKRDFWCAMITTEPLP
jgi:hypothetical protein